MIASAVYTDSLFPEEMIINNANVFGDYYLYKEKEAVVVAGRASPRCACPCTVRSLVLTSLIMTHGS